MDQTLICIGCQDEFVFTERDQEFYAEQDPPYTPPKRCKTCRDKKKAERKAQGLDK